MDSYFSLRGKHTLITGGASGIGLAIARRFVAAGAIVTIADLEDGAQIAEDIGARYMYVDVSEADSVQTCLESTVSQGGDLNVVVNNAGINGADGVDLTDTDNSLTQKLLAVNTMGVYHGLKYAPPCMRDGGVIINTASLAASYVFPGSAPYSASKASVVNLTIMAASELADRNIRVNAVAPSFVQTPLASQDMALFEKIGKYLTTVGRVAEPEEVAAVYHFLASDDAAYINGQVINVDGGMANGMTKQMLELINAS